MKKRPSTLIVLSNTFLVFFCVFYPYWGALGFILFNGLYYLLKRNKFFVDLNKDNIRAGQLLSPINGSISDVKILDGFPLLIGDENRPENAGKWFLIEINAKDCKTPFPFMFSMTGSVKKIFWSEDERVLWLNIVNKSLRINMWASFSAKYIVEKEIFLRVLPGDKLYQGAQLGESAYRGKLRIYLPLEHWDVLIKKHESAKVLESVIAVAKEIDSMQ